MQIKKYSNHPVLSMDQLNIFGFRIVCSSERVSHCLPENVCVSEKMNTIQECAGVIIMGKLGNVF